METKPIISHIVMVPFTGLGRFGGFRGDKWLKNRIKIFKEYTLQSLMNQKSLNFVLWCSWRPEEKENPIVKEFYKNLLQLRGLTVIFTYHGLCFYDDKAENAGEKLLENLKQTLPELKQHAIGDWIYLTINPSDDMYLFYIFDDLQRIPPSECAILITTGYIMNYNTKEIAEYNPDTIPPFFTIMFPRDKFLDPQKHLDYIGPYESHEYIKDYFFFETLKCRGFVVGTHGENISTTIDHPYVGRMLEDWEKDSIMILTGTLFSEPIPIKKRLRGLGKYLPEFIRNLYYKQNVIRI